jgi:Disulphide bond corrector protein DsbC
MKLFACILGLSGFAFGSPALAQPSFEEVAKKIEAKFEPATAKPGQTVTLKISIQLIDGWHTYPTFQPQKSAKLFVNKFAFPESSAVVFVGEMEDPAGAKEKDNPLNEGDKYYVYPGGATWERKAVVPPNAKSGSLSSKLTLKVLVCDKDNCLPQKTVELQPALKIAGDPVAVEPKYKAEVDKALMK